MKSKTIKAIIVSVASLIVLALSAPALGHDDKQAPKQSSASSPEVVGGFVGSVTGATVAAWATLGASTKTVVAGGLAGGKIGEKVGELVGREAARATGQLAEKFSESFPSTGEEFCRAVGGQAGCGGAQ